MKTNKVTKLGVSLLSVAALGVVAPALTDVPVFGATIVKAEETRPLKYTIAYYDKDTGEEIAPRKTGTINPGEVVNIYKDIDGYQVVSNFDEWMPGFNATYRIVIENFGFSDGRLFMDLSYKKVNADAKPSDTPKPEVKPETKPSETPKPEVKPEPKPSDTSKPEVKPEPKPSETPKPEVKPEPKPSETPKPEVKPAPKPSDTSKPEVKPEPAPKAEETRPLEYRIVYYDKDTREEIAPPKTGTINPGETVNIYRDIDGYQVVSNYDEWMPGFNASYRIMSEYFGFSKGRLFMYLDYKKVNVDAKPSDTPKPEVKPETKPSETPKPEVKPEPKPSDTSKPEVKPGTTPSETPKSEVKPAPKPSDTPKPEVKPEPKPSDTSKPEVKPELKPQTNSNTAPTAPVKPVGQTSNSKADKPTSKKETPALPNTGEQSSSLSLVGLLLASLGLAGLTYKGRH